MKWTGFRKCLQSCLSIMTVVLVYFHIWDKQIMKPSDRQEWDYLQLILNLAWTLSEPRATLGTRLRFLLKAGRPLGLDTASSAFYCFFRFNAFPSLWSGLLKGTWAGCMMPSLLFSAFLPFFVTLLLLALFVLVPRSGGKSGSNKKADGVKVTSAALCLRDQANVWVLKTSLSPL